jgi:hypothetical protein
MKILSAEEEIKENIKNKIRELLKLGSDYYDKAQKATDPLENKLYSTASKNLFAEAGTIINMLKLIKGGEEDE